LHEFAVRTVFFAVVPRLNHDDFFMMTFHSPAFTLLDDTPTLVFFSTYTLLVLFW